MNKNILKSIWAVIAGFVTVFILSSVADFLLEALGVFPAIGKGEFVSWMAALAIIYRTLFTVLGGYITAALAPNPKMRHVIILGIIGLAAASLGIVATWGKNLGPEWYPILLAVLALPSVWLGGKIKVKV